MTSFSATVEGVGFWANGLPSWQAARDYAPTARSLPTPPPSRRRSCWRPTNAGARRSRSAVALEVALAACSAAGRDPQTLPSVFASTW